MAKNSRGFAPILIVVILGAIGIIGYLVVAQPSKRTSPIPPIPFQKPTKEKYCQKDTDCVPISRECCGCPDESVNEQYYETLVEEVMARCTYAICPQEACDLYAQFPKCINNQCTLKEIDHSAYELKECLELDNPVEKDYCLHQVAKATKDQTICRLIDDDTLHDQCLRILRR